MVEYLSLVADAVDSGQVQRRKDPAWDTGLTFGEHAIVGEASIHRCEHAGDADIDVNRR